MLATSEDINHRKSGFSPTVPSGSVTSLPFGATVGMPRSTGAGAGRAPGRRCLGCSMNATCRHWSALSEWLLSYDDPSMSNPWSGTSFHSLQATSQALHPIQMLVSVKKPLRGG